MISKPGGCKFASFLTSFVFISLLMSFTHALDFKTKHNVLKNYVITQWYLLEQLVNGLIQTKMDGIVSGTKGGLIRTKEINRVFFFRKDT